MYITKDRLIDIGLSVGAIAISIVSGLIKGAMTKRQIRKEVDAYLEEKGV